MEWRRTAVSGLLAAALALSLPLVACSGGAVEQSGTSAPVDISDKLITTPYDWGCLTWDARGRASYVVDGEVRSRTGIDVSEHNGEIDWQAVADDGIEFCYIRAAWRGSTEGGLYADECFEQYYSGAREAGLDVGLYVFSQAVSAEEGREEAQLVLDLLDGRPLELAIAFDHETTADFSGRADGIGRAELTEAARAFCNTVEAAGYDAIIYGNSHDFARMDIVSFARQGYWFAEYDEAPSCPLDLEMWQYTHQGTVAGVQSTVDMNIELAHVLDE